MNDKLEKLVDEICEGEGEDDEYKSMIDEDK
jgi:hypothetical protein